MNILGFLSLVVVVIGWIVTGNTQKTILLQTLKNQARVEVSRSLREYARAVGLAEVDFEMLPRRLSTETESGNKVDWLETMGGLGRRLALPLEWVFLLEEHEALFPYTRKCRQTLVRRHWRILRPLHECVSDLRDTAKRKAAIHAVQAHLGALIVQQALIMDLQVELQNDCFGPLTCTRALPRVREDPQSPILKRNPRGELDVVPPEPLDFQEG